MRLFLVILLCFGSTGVRAQFSPPSGFPSGGTTGSPSWGTTAPPPSSIVPPTGVAPGGLAPLVPSEGGRPDLGPLNRSPSVLRPAVQPSAEPALRSGRLPDSVGVGDATLGTRTSEEWRRSLDRGLRDAFDRGPGVWSSIIGDGVVRVLENYERKNGRPLDEIEPNDVAEAARRLCGGSGCVELGNDPLGLLGDKLGTLTEAIAAARRAPDNLMTLVLGPGFGNDDIERLVQGYVRGTLTGADQDRFDSLRSLHPIVAALRGTVGIKMETPGTSRGGPPPLAPLPAVGRVYTSPAVGGYAAAPVEAGSTCAAPADGTAPESDDEFISKVFRSVGTTGLSAVPFCRAGFGSVVMIRTPKNVVCSGVRLPEQWVVTAGHCVAGDFAAVRVYHVRDEDAECLRQAAAREIAHPTDLCKTIPALAVEKVILLGGLDLALIKLEARAASIGRTADIPSMGLPEHFVLTFAGYGRSTEQGATNPGPLRVGYARGDWPLTQRQETMIDLVGIWPGQRTGAVVCPGDSGAPAFYGRAFGYHNERHDLFAISVERLGSQCQSDVLSKRVSRLVPLASLEAKRQLCPHLGNAVMLCRF